MERRNRDSVKHIPARRGGRKLPADQYGVFPGRRPRDHYPSQDSDQERAAVIRRHFAHLAVRAGLPSPEHRNRSYENLGNRELPVYKEKKKIQATIRDNQISMIEGPTGSGKSTQLVQYALEMGYKKIIYLEPRVLLADNLSDRVEYELGQQVGTEHAAELIGVRHSERSNGYGKLIEIMTPDTFVRVFNELEEYADEPVLIVGDEIHEKDFATELGVAVAAQELENHPKWRLALMSATLDAPSIQEAFGQASGKEVPLVSVEGRPHEIQYIDEPELTATEVYAKYAGDHQKTILFTAGKQEIKDNTTGLEALNLAKTLISPLHAKLSKRQIKKATSTVLKDGESQAIPATNAAQSGITIPGLTLVISDGTIRRQRLDEDGVEGLFKEQCAQDEMIQQAGRGGRDQEGAVFINCKPDDPNFEFMPIEEREKHAPAQIYHMNISNNVLAAAAIGRDFYELNERWLVNKVEQRRVLEAYDTLHRLGALDEHNQVTELGMQMSKYPVRPELARALVEAVNDKADVNRIRQLVAMISAVGAGGLPYFEKDLPQEWRNDIRKETKDDYTAQLDMFLATRDLYDGEEVNEGELQKRNYDLKNTRRAHRMYDKICRKLGYSEADLPEPPTSEDLEAIQGYLTMGLFDYAHHRLAPNSTTRTKRYVSVNPGKTGPTERERSRRGTYEGNDELVLGFPRNYVTEKDGVPELHNSVEVLIPTTPRMIAKAALWLAERVPQAPTIQGGRLRQKVLQRFGDLVLGEDTLRNVNVIHTPETKNLLMVDAFNKPTQMVSELVKIKKQLELLLRRTPKESVSQYFPEGVMTQDWLEEKIKSVINSDIDDIYMLDNALRDLVLRRENISIRTWITEAHEQEILARSPDSIKLKDGTSYTLQYAIGGKPYVSTFNLLDVDKFPPDTDHWLLPDKREVFIKYAIGKDTKWHDIGTIRRHVHGEMDDEDVEDSDEEPPELLQKNPRRSPKIVDQ